MCRQHLAMCSRLHIDSNQHTSRLAASTLLGLLVLLINLNLSAHHIIRNVLRHCAPFHHTTTHPTISRSPSANTHPTSTSALFTASMLVTPSRTLRAEPHLSVSLHCICRPRPPHQHHHLCHRLRLSPIVSPVQCLVGRWPREHICAACHHAQRLPRAIRRRLRRCGERGEFAGGHPTLCAPG